MARRGRPLDARGDAFSYATFMADLLAGTITATELHDETEDTGRVHPVTLRHRDEEGNLIVRTVNVPIRRLVSLEYEDPNEAPGQSGGRRRDGRVS